MSITVGKAEKEGAIWLKMYRMLCVHVEMISRLRPGY